MVSDGTIGEVVNPTATLSGTSTNSGVTCPVAGDNVYMPPGCEGGYLLVLLLWLKCL